MTIASLCICIAAAVVSAPPTGNGFNVAKTLFRDDYERASRRDGAPELIRAPISNGLLELTGQGVYSTSGTLDFGPPRRHFATPEDVGRHFAFGFRLYSLSGGVAGIACRSQTSAFTVGIGHVGGERLSLRVSDCGRSPKTLDLPASALPADVMLYAHRDGGYSLRVVSLADGGVRELRGDAGFFREEFADGFDVSVRLKAAAGGRARLVIDNLVAAEAVQSGGAERPVAFVTPQKEFDPERAGWKKVFEDDFDGDEIDRAKWYQLPWVKHHDFAFLDGNGHLAIKCDFEPGTTNLVSTGINSIRAFTYGYAEAKVKLTKNSGWWAAFWLYGTSNTNPGVDGSEIDIFEDYYTRAATPAGPHRPILDHNLHVFEGKALQSWNYRSMLSGTVDDWHVVGCRWTPFEISYYVDGRLAKSSANHSPYGSVTFDAKNHAALECPLHIIFNGCIMRGWGKRDTTGFKFPEHFLVDYVRFWEYPRDDSALPRVAWKGGGEERVVVPPGGSVSFEADAAPSSATRAPVVEAYLFDGGHPVASRTAPPWRFEIPFTEGHYRTTRYMAPGRSGKAPTWDAVAHAFRVYVRDAEGRIASTGNVHWRIPVGAVGDARPCQGVAQALPGRIPAWRFDEGGRGVGHHSLAAEPRTGKGLLRSDTALDCRPKGVMQLKTGEWLNYSVDVKKDGLFRVELEYGTGNDFPNKVLLLVDGVKVGEFDCPWPGKWDWTMRAAAPLDGVRLASGRHVVTLVPVGYLSIGGLAFAAVR